MSLWEAFVFFSACWKAFCTPSKHSQRWSLLSFILPVGSITPQGSSKSPEKMCFMKELCMDRKKNFHQNNRIFQSHFSTDFCLFIAGSWIGSRAVRVATTHMGCQWHRCSLTCHIVSQCSSLCLFLKCLLIHRCSLWLVLLICQSSIWTYCCQTLEQMPTPFPIALFSLCSMNPSTSTPQKPVSQQMLPGSLRTSSASSLRKHLASHGPTPS